MTIDEALDEYIGAWHAGTAPSTSLYLALVGPDAVEELGALIAAFLEVAPTVAPHPQRALELKADPLVQRLAVLEDRWWQRHH